MKWYISLIFIIVMSITSFGQEEARNKIEPVMVRDGNYHYLKSVLFKDKETDEIEFEFDVAKNNPFNKLKFQVKEIKYENKHYSFSDRDDWDDLLKYGNVNHNRVNDINAMEHTVCSHYREGGNNIAIHYIMELHYSTENSCHSEKIGILSALLILDNTGKVIKEIPYSELEGIRISATVSQDCEKLAYSYVDEKTMEEGFIIRDIILNNNIYHYKSSEEFKRGTSPFMIIEDDVHFLFTDRKNIKEGGKLFYLFLDESKIYSLKLPTQYDLLDMKNCQVINTKEGLKYKYIDKNTKFIPLSEFNLEKEW